MQLWWRRTAPTADSTATPPPAASAPVAAPPPAWTQLPALQRVVTPTPAIAPLDAFVGALSTRQDPSFLAPLAHAVHSSAPSGSVGGLMQPGLPQPSHSGLDLPLRGSAAAEPRLQRSVQTAVSSLPEMPGYSMPVSSPPFASELTTAPAAQIDRALPTVHQEVPADPASSSQDAEQSSPVFQAPLTGSSDAEWSASVGGESPEHAGSDATPLASLPLATSTTKPAPVVSRVIDTSAPVGTPPAAARPRFQVQPPIDLVRVDRPLVGEPSATPSAPSNQTGSNSPPTQTQPVQSLPLSAAATPTVSRLVGDSAAATMPTASTAAATSQTSAAGPHSESTQVIAATTDADSSPGTVPLPTAPTVGLAAPLPVQTHAEVNQASALPVSTPSQQALPTAAPARRGLGAPLPPQDASVQRQPAPGAASASGTGISAGGAGPAALVGLAHMLDQASGGGGTVSPTLPLQQIIQRSVGFGSAADDASVATPSSEQTEPTFSAPDAPLVGDGPSMTSAGTFDSAFAEAATQDSSGHLRSPDLVVASVKNAASGPHSVHPGSSSLGSGVPLQRYAGSDSVPTTAPAGGPTAPLIGDLPPIAVLTGAAAAGPSREQVQRAVEVAVPVRYGPPSMPQSSGAPSGDAVARTSSSYAPMTTPATTGMLEYSTASDGGPWLGSGAPLQRIEDPASSTVLPAGGPLIRAGRTGSPAVQRFGQPARPALVVARSSDPGQAAISAGVARPDGANSVVFDQPFAPPEVGVPEVQRAPEPTTTTSVVAPVAAAQATPATPDINELAQRLFDPLSARLKTELWLDRERAGFVTDLRR